jgi:DNA-binding transcriptional regulator GbsR (MarR family)
MANEIVPRLSVVAGPPNPAADMRSLLEALNNLNAAKEKLDKDYRSERLKSVLSLASEAAKSVDANSFVNRHKQLGEIEARFHAQVDALNFFGQKFQELVEDYCHSFPIQVEQPLRETLQNLEDAQKQRNSEEAATNQQITKIKQLLELCSSTAQSKADEVKAEREDASRYKG